MALPYYSPKPPGGRDRFVLRPGTRSVEVVGLSHRMDAVEALAAELDPSGAAEPIEVQLVREPNNLHDQNALAVWAGRHGHIGYLPATYAADFGPALDEALAGHNRKLDIEAHAMARVRRSDDGDDDRIVVAVYLGRRVVTGEIQPPRPTRPAPRRPAGNDEVRVIVERVRKLPRREVARLIGHLEALLDELGD